MVAIVLAVGDRDGTAAVATMTEAAPAMAVAEVAAAEVREEMILFYY